MEEGTVFEIPILPDIYGQTPLDMCLGINLRRGNERLVYLEKTMDLMTLRSATNEAMAEIIFKNINKYEYMQSSQIIHESVIKATKLGLPSIGEYLESRLIKPEHIFESSTQHSIKAKVRHWNPSMGYYGRMKA